MRLAGALTVGRARLRGGRPADRQPLEAALEQIALAGLGLPPRAVLYVPRLAPRARLRPRAPAVFAGALARDLQREARGAARCAAGEPAPGGSLLFDCEADFLAWLVHGWVRRSETPSRALAALARPRAPADHIANELLRRGELVPALLVRLARLGSLAEVLAAIAPEALDRSLAAVAHAHGLPVPRPAFAGPRANAPPAEPSAGPGGKLPALRHATAPIDHAAAEQARAIAPEALAAPLPSEARALTVAALALTRAPAWIRTPPALAAIARLSRGEPLLPPPSAMPQRLAANCTGPAADAAIHAEPQLAKPARPAYSQVPLGDPAPVPSPPPPVADAPIRTLHGGLLFLLVPLLQAGLYADFTRPAGANLPLSPWLLLRRLGRCWFPRRFAADPLDGVLARLAGLPPEAPLGRAPRALGLRAIDRSLRAELIRRTRLAPRAAIALLRQPARLWVSDAALDAEFALETHPLALRRAGLDRDPGWIPAAGRAVAFHFR